MEQEATNNQGSVDLVELSPPFFLRVGAAFIDYIVFLALPLASLVTETTVGGSGLGVFSDRTIWFLACVVGFANCVLLPQIAGQSIGKMLTGIRVVSNDLGELRRVRLFVRQTLGYFVTLATFGIGFLAAAVIPSGRSLHDYISGTTTVRARKTLVRV